MWLFVLFLVVPIIEIALFIQVGGAIGLFPTLAIVVLTAVLGTFMIRTQGAMALNRLQSSLNELQNPTEPLAHGAMILFAGALLLTPGFFTDGVGFALLIPPIRSALYAYIRARMNVQSFTVGGQSQQRQQHADVVIDGEYEEIKEPPKNTKPGTSGWTKD
ncbi:MAG: FxsA family protein [Marinosulfonomonas sp.]|nr:FxsA family protein [Marinosulfonomonas sp.]